MAHEIGTRSALRRAARELGPGARAATYVSRPGTSLAQLLPALVAAGSGHVIAHHVLGREPRFWEHAVAYLLVFVAAIVVGLLVVRFVAAVREERGVGSGLLVVLDHELRIARLSGALPWLPARGAPIVVPFDAVDRVAVTTTPYTGRLRLHLVDGTTVAVEANRHGSNAVNLRVLQLVERALAEHRRHDVTAAAAG